MKFNYQTIGLRDTDQGVKSFTIEGNVASESKIDTIIKCLKEMYNDLGMNQVSSRDIISEGTTTAVVLRVYNGRRCNYRRLPTDCYYEMIYVTGNQEDGVVGKLVARGYSYYASSVIGFHLLSLVSGKLKYVEEAVNPDDVECLHLTTYEKNCSKLEEMAKEIEHKVYRR